LTLAITCIVIVVVLYTIVWLALYRWFTAWSAERGVELSGRTARLATWSLMSLVSLPVSFVSGWLCQLLTGR
jgi:hypothetical protein